MNRINARNTISLLLTTLFFSIVTLSAYAEPPKMKMTTEIPPQITTPDKVETRLGTLEFFDGFPTDATAEKVFDNLDFLRGVEVFLNGCPGASMVALREGLRHMGAAGGSRWDDLYHGDPDGCQIAVSDTQHRKHL